MTQETERKIRIGDIYMMNFGGSGSEQQGWRPGLVFQNNIGNDHSPNIIALPITSSLKKAGQPTHVVLPKETGLLMDSMVLAENPERMSKDRVGKYIATLSPEYMEKVATANLIATSAIAFIDPQFLLKIREMAIRMNNQD